jgi:hypothetical protein
MKLENLEEIGISRYIHPTNIKQEDINTNLNSSILGNETLTLIVF